MTQFNYIKDIAKYGLENDQEKLLSVLNELIEHSRNTKKLNLALQLQSILKDSIRNQKGSLSSLNTPSTFLNRKEDDTDELILEKLTSDYSFENLVCSKSIKAQLEYFLQEHRQTALLEKYGLPVSNKVLLHGPSGCGKTLASYVIAGELKKLMIVINLGAIVSSKLGETSKNLAKIFRRAAAEDCIIFLDEFDSLGKIRDYNQDHGEMKRVVNTILQLFDYLPQSSIVIAATNQADMVDDALLRRFDLNVKFELPDAQQIKELVKITLKNGQFSFDNQKAATLLLKEALGLSYYSIQKTLITAIKRSLLMSLETEKAKPLYPKIKVKEWELLLKEEKEALGK